MILLILYALFKLFLLISYGYYAFRRVSWPDCYAHDNKPYPKPVDKDDENVT